MVDLSRTPLLGKYTVPVRIVVELSDGNVEDLATIDLEIPLHVTLTTPDEPIASVAVDPIGGSARAIALAFIKTGQRMLDTINDEIESGARIADADWG